LGSRHATKLRYTEGNMLKHYRAGIYVGVMLVAGTFLAAGQQSQRPTILISSSKSDFKEGDPVKIHVILFNQTSEPFSVFKSVGEAHAELYYVLRVTAPSGKEAPLTPYGKAVQQREVMAISRIREFVKPGDSVGDNIDVSRMVDMSKTGTYRIQVRRPNPLSPKSDLESNTLTITVDN